MERGTLHKVRKGKKHQRRSASRKGLYEGERGGRPDLFICESKETNDTATPTGGGRLGYGSESGEKPCMNTFHNCLKASRRRISKLREESSHMAK